VTAAALTYSVQEHTLPTTRVMTHPVPKGRESDEASKSFKRATIASISLHLLVVLVALAIQYWPSDELVGTPQEQVIDVTLIPLSALDTVLPKGAPDPQPAEQQPQELTKPIEAKPKQRTESAPPKKIVAARSLDSIKAPPREQQSDASEQAGTQSAASAEQIGVANGEVVSLENARISYQDMVATLLARAKRYPERALKRGMTGEGTIRIEINSDGSLSTFQIVRSTETSILDDELRAMVERASPFPAFPEDLRKSSLALVVPVAFRLES
jgi:TonB family protein